MRQTIFRRILVEFWVLVWAQVVIYIALASHVADSQPSPPPPPSFALPKDVLPQGNGGPMRWLEPGFRFLKKI
jgi:hypothetical protein